MPEFSVTANWAGRDAESLLWLASFPRSGNTFTRLLLANYFAAGETAFDINQLHDFIPPDTSSVLWETFLGKSLTAIERDGMWKDRLSFVEHRRKTQKSPSLAALKTHSANIEALGTKAFEFRKSDRIIYIVRHPLDVALSYSNFNSLDQDFIAQTMCQPGMAFTDGKIGVIEVRSSWAEHLSSWLNIAACPILLVRYEELRQNTEQVLQSMLAFLGVAVSPQRVRQAVEASRFDKVRQQEAVHRFNEAPETGIFFRKGTSLQWLRELTPDQAYRLADGCEPIMSKLGYTHPRDVFFDGRNALQPIHLQNLL